MKQHTYLILVLLFCATNLGLAQDYKIYDREQEKVISVEELVRSSSDADVLFFGEQHDDEIAHELQDKIYELLLNEYRNVSLSLEMFETDGQLILDEYLSGYITESKMLNDARAWDNYPTAYRPLVERAKEKGQTVIAANAPRRYVSMVSQKGLSSLDALPKSSKAYLPPLPIFTDDKGYYERFQALMGGANHGMGDSFFHAQCLWDASMAYRIFQHWKKHKKERIFHLNGRFHTDFQQGTVTQLRRLKDKIEIKNISCFPAEGNFDKPDWSAYANQGDFIVLTKS